MAPHTRPRPSSIDQLPDECEGIVAWAAQELANTPRSQTDIYAEFVLKLQQLQTEHRGELEFTIPAFSSFNRHALRLASMMARDRRVQQIANSINAETAGKDANALTQAASRMVKTLLVEAIEAAGEAGFSPQETMQAASAIRQLAQAEGISAAMLREFNRDLGKKIEKVGRAAGVSPETLAEINRRLGVV